MRRVVSLTCLLVVTLASAADATPKRKLLPRPWASAHKVGVKHGARDADRDGLTNWGEYRARTDPRRKDSDRDGIVDAREDRDRDKLDNAEEIAAGTDPRRRDSDGDRVRDGREDRDRDRLANADERPTGHDLRLRDSDRDGVADGRDNAGWIAAAGAGSVTIRLAAGGTLTARLTGDSWVDCTLTPTSGVDADTSHTPTSDTSPTASDGQMPETPVPDEDVPALDDDPAGLPSTFEAALAEQFPDDDETETSTPDLGSCGANLRVGTAVRKAGVEPDPWGPVLTVLELMKP